MATTQTADTATRTPIHIYRMNELDRVLVGSLTHSDKRFVHRVPGLFREWSNAAPEGSTDSEFIDWLCEEHGCAQGPDFEEVVLPQD